MTQVDFYILPEATSEARWLFACRLIDKVQRMGVRVLVALDNEAEARASSMSCCGRSNPKVLSHIN